MGQRRRRHAKSLDWAALRTYVDRVQHQLGLDHWSCKIADAPCDDDHVAQIQRIGHTRSVVLWLTRHWGKLTPELQRETLVHELLHVHFFPLNGVLDEHRVAFGKQARALSLAVERRCLEETIEALTAALSPLLPLPPGDRP